MGGGQEIEADFAQHLMAEGFNNARLGIVSKYEGFSCLPWRRLIGMMHRVRLCARPAEAFGMRPELATGPTAGGSAAFGRGTKKRLQRQALFVDFVVSSV
jgi:hypothetical protein